MTDQILSHPENDREHTYHTRSLHRRRTWSRRSRLLLILVLVLVLINFFTALLLGTQVYTLSDQNQTLRGTLAQTEKQLHQIAPELHKLRADLDTLTRGKLPNLHRLEYDRVVPLDKQYLKNITFTEMVNNDHRSHEYRLVLQNNTGIPLWPQIQLLIFDALGIQVGSAEIGTRQPNALKAGHLGVGEVRSYAAVIELADKKAVPTYFMIRIPEEEGNTVNTSQKTD